MFKKDSFLFGTPKQLLGFDDKDTILHKKHVLSAVFGSSFAYIKGHSLHLNNKKILLPALPTQLVLTESLILVSCTGQLVAYTLEGIYLDSIDIEGHFTVVGFKNSIGIYGYRLLKLYKLDRIFRVVVPSRIESRDYTVACFVDGIFHAVSDHCLCIVKDSYKDITVDCTQWSGICSFLNGYLVAKECQLISYLNCEETMTMELMAPIIQLISNSSSDKAAFLSTDLYIVSGRDLKSWVTVILRPNFGTILNFDYSPMKPLIALNTSRGPFLIDYETQKYLPTVENSLKIKLHPTGLFLLTLSLQSLNCWQIHNKDFILQWERLVKIKDIAISKNGQHYLTFDGHLLNVYQFWTNQLLWTFEPYTDILYSYLEGYLLMMLMNDKTVLIYNILTGEKQLQKTFDTMPSKCKLIDKSLLVYTDDMVLYKNEKINASCWFNSSIKGFSSGKIEFEVFTMTAHLSKVTDITYNQKKVISTDSDGILCVWHPTNHSSEFSKQCFSIESALKEIQQQIEEESIVHMGLENAAENELLSTHLEFELCIAENDSKQRIVIEKEASIFNNDIENSKKRQQVSHEQLTKNIKRQKKSLKESSSFYEELIVFEKQVTEQLNQAISVLSSDQTTSLIVAESNLKSISDKSDLNHREIDSKVAELNKSTIDQEISICSDFDATELGLKSDLEHLYVKELQSFYKVNKALCIDIYGLKSKYHKASLGKQSLQTTLNEIRQTRNSSYSKVLSDQKRTRYMKRSIANIDKDVLLRLKMINDRDITHSKLNEKREELEKYNFILKTKYTDLTLTNEQIQYEYQTSESASKAITSQVHLTSTQLKDLKVDLEWKLNYLHAVLSNRSLFKQSTGYFSHKLSNFHSSLRYLITLDNDVFWHKQKLFCDMVIQHNDYPDMQVHIDNTNTVKLLEKLQEKESHLKTHFDHIGHSKIKQKEQLITMFNDTQLLQAANTIE